MRERILLFVVVVITIFASYGKNDVKTVEGECRGYKVEGYMSLNEARAEVERLAKIDALNHAFGNNISSTSILEMAQGGEDFFSLSFDNVNGVWIETIGEPKIERYLSEDGSEEFMNCYIKGKARAKKRVDIDLRFKTLRNGFTDDCESVEFRDGNSLYVDFQSPVDGYVSIFLYDPEQHVVSCLLPYRSNSEGSVKVDHDKRYLFFSKKHSAHPYEVQECEITCSRDGETNIIFLVFSKNPFTKPLVSVGDERYYDNLTWHEFQKWLAKCKHNDTEFTVRQSAITIRK